MTSSTPPSTARTSTARPSILVVLGHPRSDSLCGALADAYAEGARAAGADVTGRRRAGSGARATRIRARGPTAMADRCAGRCRSQRTGAAGSSNAG